jgi:hypothetical protein
VWENFKQILKDSLTVGVAIIGKENKKENIFMCNPVLSFQYDRSRKNAEEG